MKLRFLAALAAAALLSGLAAGVPAAASSSRFPANIDYADSRYGQWDAAALASPAIGAAVVPMYWRIVEPSRGRYNWAPLDHEMAVWAAKGKKVVLMLPFTSELGGGCTGHGFMPRWEIARIPHFCDTDKRMLIPDYFSRVFLADWRTFVAAVASHVARSGHAGAVAYVRIAVGLGDEGFYLRYHQADFNADKAKLIKWGWSPQAWAAWQERLLGFYAAQFPTVQDIYAVVKLEGNVQDEVAKWNVAHGGGISSQCLSAGGTDRDFAGLTAWVHANHPTAYIQFQTCGNDSGSITGIIGHAEALGGRSIEWYPHQATDAAARSVMAAYQRFVDVKFP